MPRKPRVHVPGGIYHVILRGNDRQRIFADEIDFRRLEALLGDGCERYGVRTHAYCWMTNHVHLALQVGTRPLGALMRWLGSQYARGFNRRHGRTGHVFERRHYAELVSDDSYLLWLVRYIHFNPVKGGLVTSPEDYSWSSHRAYLGYKRAAWLTTELVLAIFDDEPQRARSQYARFIAQSVNLGDELVESRPAVSSSRTSKCSAPMVHVPTDAGTAAPTRPESLEAIVERHCRDLGLSPEALAAPHRIRRHAKARALIAREAIETGVATLADVARKFGRSESVIWRTMNRYRCEQGNTSAMHDFPTPGPSKDT